MQLKYDAFSRTTFWQQTNFDRNIQKSSRGALSVKGYESMRLNIVMCTPCLRFFYTSILDLNLLGSPWNASNGNCLPLTVRPSTDEAAHLTAQVTQRSEPVLPQYKPQLCTFPTTTVPDTAEIIKAEPTARNTTTRRVFCTETWWQRWDFYSFQDHYIRLYSIFPIGSFQDHYIKIHSTNWVLSRPLH